MSPWVVKGQARGLADGGEARGGDERPRVASSSMPFGCPGPCPGRPVSGPPSAADRPTPQVLKILLYLCGHGSSSFLLILKRNSAFIQEAAGTGALDSAGGRQILRA